MAIRNQQEMSHAEVTAEVRACRRLWASVVRTAADDLHSGIILTKASRQYVGSSTASEAWFASEDCEIGTFLWCCDVLDLNAQAVRRAILNGQAKKSHGRYATLLKLFNKTRESDETPDQAM